MADDRYDVLVIGAGPGGYVAAIRAAQLGMKVGCVEAQKLGGVCNNWGCIPTKALLESANYARHVKDGLDDFGIRIADVELDLAAAAERSGQVAEQGAKGVGYLFRKNGVDHVQGWGRLAGDGKVRVVPGRNAGHGDEEASDEGEERTLEADHIIIATGSRPKNLPFLEADGDRVWNSDHAVFPPEAPSSLAIIGAGAVGMEYADVYAAFGTEVTIIEALDHVLPNEDPEVAAVVAKSFRNRGMEIYEGARLEDATVQKTQVKLQLKTKDGEEKELKPERVLLAIGRAPVIDDLGLEDVGVELDDNGFIAVDEQMRTNVPGVYAIGDVCKPPLLAHKASHEGVAAVEAIAGEPHAGVDYDNIPAVTYCHPEVASVGMTEEQAREAGYDVEVGKFPWSASGRARTAGETEGFVKVVRETRYSEVLGAQIVGPHASELIGEFVVGRHLETTAEEMDKAIHPHPTLSEAIAEASLFAVGRPIHI